jgi:hypothetical protein
VEAVRGLKHRALVLLQNKGDLVDQVVVDMDLVLVGQVIHLQ